MSTACFPSSMRDDHVTDPAVQAAIDAIGAEIRRLRLAIPATQRELEELAWLDQSTISRIECGLMPRLRLYRYARLRAAVEGRLGPVRRIPRRTRRPRRRDDWDWR